MIIMKAPKLMNNIIIIGASGHGSVILDSIERTGRFNIIGFLDSFKPTGYRINGYEVLGNETDLPRLINRFNISAGVVAIGDNWVRKTVVDRISRIVPDFKYAKVIHPRAVVGKDVTIGAGSVLMPGAIVNANAVVGEHCIINTNSSLGHDGRMYNFSSLASGVCMGGNCTLGPYSAVSLGTNVIENIHIEEHTVVGAGSLVVSDIQSHVLAYGSPAKVIRGRKIGDKYLAGNKKQIVTPFITSDF
jgi:sugar O-acyltransferase (sialic acid O-acetyltransferase NeuD family)